jgi:hypothetical protein
MASSTGSTSASSSTGRRRQQRAPPLRRLRGRGRGRARGSGAVIGGHAELLGHGGRSRSTTPWRSGKNSVKVTGKGGDCNHVFFSNTAVIGTLHPVVYGRLFLRLSMALGAGHAYDATEAREASV